MQMANINPSPSEVRQALLDYGVRNLDFYKGWDTIGRPWKGPDGSPGLTGGVIHHTANPGASSERYNDILYWATHAYDKPVCNMLIGKNKSTLLASGSAYHCGLGGPVPALGIPQHGYYGQTRLFGIEIDDPGVKIGTINDYQIDNTVKTMAALADLCGWDVDKSILTHGCYTGGCHGANPNGPSPSLGRKNDTLEAGGQFGVYTQSTKAEPYNAPWWREQIKSNGKTNMWDGTIPLKSAAARAATEGLKNKAAWRCACRLYDIGMRAAEPKGLGEQQYPIKTMQKFQRSIGLSADKADGMPNKTTWVKLFGKNK